MISTEKPMNLFEKLRGSPNVWQSSSSIPDQQPLFVITPGERGGSVAICDIKGKQWNYSYRYFQGEIRNALKAVESVQRHSLSGFSWDEEEDAILLAEHEHLMSVLESTGRLVNNRLEPISVEEKEGSLAVILEKSNGVIQSSLRLQVGGERVECDFEVLTDSRVLVKGERIIRVPPMGDGFLHLPLFATRIQESELPRYLTLLYSAIDQVKLVYDGYKYQEGEPKSAENCIIFEESDEEGNLKLRMSLALTGFEPDFLESYEISRVASVNELERKIIVSRVMYQPLQECIREVERGLKKIMRSNKGDFFKDGNFFLIGADLVSPFLEDVLPGLLCRYACYGAENLTKFKLRTGKPKVSLSSIKSGIDFLDTSVQLQIDDQTISLAEAIDQFKKNRYIALNDGSRAIINEEYIKRLERIFRRRKKNGNERISYFDLPVVEDLIEECDRIRINRMEGIAAIKKALTSTEMATLPKINATLRPYQKTGYQWMRRLNAARLGGCLADDMGLGKTLQAITLLKATTKKNTAPSLVVMPRSLIFNWQKEIEKFAPQLTFAVHHGQSRNLSEAAKSQIILTTYGTLRSDIEIFQDIRFHYLILDESQNIKNPASQVTRAVQLLLSDYRLALSGTPIENNLTELYSLFKFLNPAMFDSLPAFNRSYALPISKDNDHDAMQELQRKIAPFILRRTKKEVLKDLPDKVEQILYVDMSEEQASLYESRRRYYRELIKGDLKTKGINNCQFMILQAFTELRQLASTPATKTDGEIISAKREMVVNELTEATANGHKCLLFANFIGALEGLSDDLNTAGVEHVMMTGATRDRQRLVETFQNDDSVKVFLMTLKTGGVGLNLTAADYVFIYDPWWNLAAETQAVDRTHRIGQKNTVFTYKLVARNTIEEKIIQLQEQKGELFNNLIGADAATLKSFTESDIQFALGGNL